MNVLSQTENKLKAQLQLKLFKLSRGTGSQRINGKGNTQIFQLVPINFSKDLRQGVSNVVFVLGVNMLRIWVSITAAPSLGQLVLVSTRHWILGH